jgi:hypothetical protein
MTYIFKNFEGPIDLATAHYELIEYAKSVSPEWELTPICPGAPQKHHRAPASLARGVKVTLEMGELEVRFGDGSLHTVCNSCPPEHLTRLQTKILLHLSPLLNPDLKSKLLPRIALWPVPHHVGTPQ